MNTRRQHALGRSTGTTLTSSSSRLPEIHQLAKETLLLCSDPFDPRTHSPLPLTCPALGPTTATGTILSQGNPSETAQTDLGEAIVPPIWACVIVSIGECSCLYVCTFVRVIVSVCRCAYVCWCDCVYVGLCVCDCMCVFLNVYVYVYVCVCLYE